MDTNKNIKADEKGEKQSLKLVGSDFFELSWKESWTYIKTVVDVVREPVLILDKDFRVIAANAPFYRMFQVEKKETEGKIVYELGKGQWNIPSLRKLLETILPKHTFFNGFEVASDFPLIGRKVMILNARQIHYEKKNVSKSLPPIILLAIEDVTEMMVVAEMLARHTNQFMMKTLQRSEKMEEQIKVLEKEINELKDNKKKI
jgi:hypothetical protein